MVDTRVRSLSIVIPAFNETARLPKTVYEIDRYVRDNNYDAEILIVDDGSTDDTFEVARALEGELPLVRALGYRENRGKGFAVRTGVLSASRETILFTDADLSTPIQVIARLWPWYDHGCDVVIASRAQAQSEVLLRQPFYREGMGRVFNKIINLMGVRGFKDTQCGFKLFKSRVAKLLFSRLKTRGFAFDVEVLIRARDHGCRIAEVGVHWINSPTSRVHPVKDSARMLLEILRMRGFI